MDTIILRDYRLLTRIGCTEEERAAPQEILVTVEFRHPTTHIAKTDRLDEAIDYMEMVEMMKKIATTERWTIERLAEDIAAEVLKKWQLQGGVKVSVEKHPPIPASSVTLTIERP